MKKLRFYVDFPFFSPFFVFALFFASSAQRASKVAQLGNTPEHCLALCSPLNIRKEKNRVFPREL